MIGLLEHGNLIDLSSLTAGLQADSLQRCTLGRYRVGKDRTVPETQQRRLVLGWALPERTKGSVAMAMILIIRIRMRMIASEDPTLVVSQDSATADGL